MLLTHLGRGLSWVNKSMGYTSTAAHCAVRNSLFPRGTPQKKHFFSPPAGWGGGRKPPTLPPLRHIYVVTKNKIWTPPHRGVGSCAPGVLNGISRLWSPYVQKSYPPQGGGYPRALGGVPCRPPSPLINKNKMNMRMYAPPPGGGVYAPVRGGSLMRTSPP